MLFDKYRLNDGSIYWHKLYFAIVPVWMTKYGPPLGDMNYAAYLVAPHKYAIDVYYRIKWFIQRGYRGYADCDVWSIDSYLAGWLPLALWDLKKHRLGHPGGLTNKTWGDKLDRMIDAFKIAQKFHNFEYQTPEEGRVAMKQFRKDFDVFKNYFFNLWD
jgi:hypothetical protein